MALLEFRDIECPCCGEPITLALDASAGSQRYIEDCPVCCRPIMVVLEVDDNGATSVAGYAQDDA
ncbi:CPXCG motif-containing cysteine-rich protein [Thermomonas sp. XSG]|uniref:CPXCG motif-containing cysteine-rich protein n=1 Tax=Thermomonas sp. XSG TaxID=2771436 RepID=UPI00167FEF70|nr:CPXCG motif-containing cysteine-rich protein [Thermomonas sp. XSG]QNU15331.1 CPXCG motif-containing cysteine-rich protein [Thermomonas sp. XSG]